MKLNNLQLGVLRRLRDEGPSSSYRLNAGLNTLNALGLKKLVTADNSAVGAMAWPRIGIKWSITDAGLRHVAHLDKDGLPITNGEHK